MKISQAILLCLCFVSAASPCSTWGQDGRSFFLEQPIKSIPIHQGTQTDLEELDLNNGKESAISRNAPLSAPVECDAKIAHGASVGIWQKNFPPSVGCSVRLFAKTQMALAYSVNNSLWCMDLGHRKAQMRALNTANLPRETIATNPTEARPTNAQADLQSYIGMNLSSILLAPPPKIQTKNAAVYEPSRGPSPLFWDAKERELCTHGSQVSSELAPSLMAYAPGKITTPSGTCDATIIEANLLHGRYALSRISWIHSKCPGFIEPNPREMADAISAGLPTLAAWQSQHFTAYRWQGPSPRTARGRLADAR